MKRNRYAAFTVFMFIFLMLFTGTGETVEFKDGVGRLVNVPDKPSRIISLAPNITEVLFAVGAGDQVVGVTDYCDYPDEARSRTRIGGFVNPSLEVIVSLQPDLIVGTADGNRPADVMRMEKAGLTVFVIDTRTVDDIYESIKTIGQLAGQEMKAQDLLAVMARRHDEARERTGDHPQPKVLFLVGNNPLIGVGPGTFIHHLIGEAGGVNVLSGTQVKYPLISMENLLAMDPDVIILNIMGEDSSLGVLSELPGWESLSAVSQGRVYFLRDDAMLRPGPRVIEALDLLVDLFNLNDRMGMP